MVAEVTRTRKISRRGSKRVSIHVTLVHYSSLKLCIIKSTEVLFLFGHFQGIGEAFLTQGILTQLVSSQTTLTPCQFSPLMWPPSRCYRHPDSFKQWEEAQVNYSGVSSEGANISHLFLVQKVVVHVLLGNYRLEQNNKMVLSHQLTAHSHTCTSAPYAMSFHLGVGNHSIGSQAPHFKRDTKKKTQLLHK